MARTAQVVKVGKRKIEISNLEKILYPDEHVLKAEIIEYYLKVAPTILHHIKGRPLSLVRYPEGIDNERFFQKNRPDWAPDWVEYVKLGKEKKDYIMATEEATLVWLANLACLELHQLHCRHPHFEAPDYIVYDLDPPEGYLFTKVVEITIELRHHLESFGYQVFPKTTGGKGIHLLTPIEPKWDFHTAFEAAGAIAKTFVDRFPKQTTLHIKKEARKGRILVDIYRNRTSQSIIGAYSLRGSSAAPVSMPLTWESLEKLTDPNDFTIRTVLDHLLSEGDAWEGFAAYAVPLHTQRKASAVRKKDLPASPHYKSPEQLKSYGSKRDFQKTPEPVPAIADSEGNAFVVHRHHASRLHYDLRLEKEGALKSWAVPKGLPPRPGIMRLAVATEDHPLEYLTFEGKIPKGQYGGGNMWVYASGKYEITKEKKNGFYFTLHGKELTGEYRVHHTKDKEWLLERVDHPQIDWPREILTPMMAKSLNKPPKGDNYIYEVKWDGIRVLIHIDEEKLTIRSRNRRDITLQFPELVIPEKAVRATSAVFDGEIVCLDAQGKPDFKTVINRLMTSNEGAIKRSSARYPAHCYLFDCLYLDGRSIINEPLLRRREWLLDVVRKDTPYRASEIVEDGNALFEAARKHGLEGIMAKERDSKYFPGKRSGKWYKVKVRKSTDCLIIGYTTGKGDRDKYFGALHLGEMVDGNLQYRGKVGTGFDENSMKTVFKELKKLKQTDRPVEEKPLDHASTIWVNPELYCEIKYSSITNNNTYREPVFLRLRPDLSPHD